MRRYERASTLLTSNRPVDDWGKLLGDSAAAKWPALTRPEMAGLEMSAEVLGSQSESAAAARHHKMCFQRVPDRRRMQGHEWHATRGEERMLRDRGLASEKEQIKYLIRELTWTATFRMFCGTSGWGRHRWAHQSSSSRSSRPSRLRSVKAWRRSLKRQRRCGRRRMICAKRPTNWSTGPRRSRSERRRPTMRRGRSHPLAARSLATSPVQAKGWNGQLAGRERTLSGRSGSSSSSPLDPRSGVGGRASRYDAGSTSWSTTNSSSPISSACRWRHRLQRPVAANPPPTRDRRFSASEGAAGAGPAELSYPGFSSSERSSSADPVSASSTKEREASIAETSRS
jgi:hypothetical protein